jgi:hypothetical protein
LMNDLAARDALDLLMLQVMEAAREDGYLMAAPDEFPCMAPVTRISGLVGWVRIVVDKPDVH